MSAGKKGRSGERAAGDDSALPAPAGRGASPTGEGRSGEGAAPGAGRLLLVEDEAKVARFVGQGLREEGYEVDAARTVAEAGARLAASVYDLLILDWMLPDGDGLQLARACRGQGLQTPIIMLTARDAISERVTALDAGVDDYLVKPFAFAELVARVRARLRRSAAPATVLRAFDLELDLLRHSARRGGTPLSLTAKEFAVLAYLARHPGRAVSRAELLREVWAEGDAAPAARKEGSPANIVDAQIARLREKLGDGEGGAPLIHTVRRIGYALGKVPDDLG